MTLPLKKRKENANVSMVTHMPKRLSKQPSISTIKMTSPLWQGWPPEEKDRMQTGRQKKPNTRSKPLCHLLVKESCMCNAANVSSKVLLESNKNQQESTINQSQLFPPAKLFHLKHESLQHNEHYFASIWIPIRHRDFWFCFPGAKK